MDFDHSTLYMEIGGFGSTLGHRHIADFHPFWMFFFFFWIILQHSTMQIAEHGMWKIL
jgi:hypothetical protein